MRVKVSQKQQILHHLTEVGPLTPATAVELMGCWRLAARIRDLRNDGHPIQSGVVNGTFRYWMEGDHVA